MIEHQNDISHEEQRIEQRRTQRTDKVTPAAPAVDKAQRLEDQTDAEAHEHAHDNAQHKGIQRTDLEEHAGHAHTGKRVLEADETEYRAENGAGRRAHRHRADRDRHGQERHIQRSDRNAAKADQLHHDLDRRKQTELCEKAHVGFVVIHFYSSRSRLSIPSAEYRAKF